MNQPQYQLRITHDQVTCLGEQLAAILQSIKEFIDEGVWYASDVDTSCDNLKITDLTTGFPYKIGSTENMIQFAKSIHQFLSGVFMLMPFDSGKSLNVKYFTEDEQFRAIGNAILEIRTFDTTCFMIYSNNLGMTKALSKSFNGQIIYKNNEMN